VIGKVYLGGFQCAEKLQTLNDLSIKRVMVCGAGLEQPFLGQGIEYLKFDLEDSTDQMISHCFEPAHAFIQAAGEGENVLVHCAAGVSRSATIVLSYLMRYHSMGLHDAIKYLRSKRRCICPNPGFMEQLVDYGKSL
jgi:protein-tyrosine phosphatase